METYTKGQTALPWALSAARAGGRAGRVRPPRSSDARVAGNPCAQVRGRRVRLSAPLVAWTQSVRAAIRRGVGCRTAHVALQFVLGERGPGGLCAGRRS